MTETDAVVINQHLSRADYFWLLMVIMLRKWYVTALILVGAVILVLGITTGVYTLLCVFIFLFIVGYPPVAGLMRVFDRKNRDMFLPVRLEFNEAEITIESALSKGALDWDTYCDWQKIGRFYMLMLSSQTSHFIPASGLTEQETARFEALLRSRIKDHR